MKIRFNVLDPHLREKIKGLTVRETKLMYDIYFGLAKSFGASLEDMEKERLRRLYGNN